MMTHNINDLPVYRRIHRHVVTNVLRKPILSGPFESDIGKVWDMLKIATEHKVYLQRTEQLPGTVKPGGLQ